jgi:hypothetical protein
MLIGWFSGLKKWRFFGKEAPNKTPGLVLFLLSKAGNNIVSNVAVDPLSKIPTVHHVLLTRI